MRRRTAAVVGGVLVLALTARVDAGPPTERLHQFFADVDRVIADAVATGDAETPRARILALGRDLVDVPSAAELVLGPEWQVRTPAEREEFARAFAGLLERAFVAAAASRASVAGGIRVRYLGERPEPGGVIVETAVASKSGDDMSLDYRMVERGGRWMVRDVLVEHVSIAENYRAQIRRLRREWSYRELVAYVKARGEPSDADAVDVIPVVATAAPDAQTRLEQQHRRLVDVIPVDVTAAPVEAAIPPPVAEIRPPAAAAPPPAPATLWVQVGAFRAPEAAARVAARLRDRPIVISVEPSSLVRVRVGPFTERTAAIATMTELTARGYAPFLLDGSRPSTRSTNSPGRSGDSPTQPRVVPSQTMSSRLVR
jgi:phospholipid transport system substrate-binding protein